MGAAGKLAAYIDIRTTVRFLAAGTLCFPFFIFPFRVGSHTSGLNTPAAGVGRADITLAQVGNTRLHERREDLFTARSQ